MSTHQIRTCLACKKKSQKSQLYRWVSSKNKLVKDKQQNMPGRGHYFHQGRCEQIATKYKLRSKNE